MRFRWCAPGGNPEGNEKNDVTVTQTDASLRLFWHCFGAVLLFLVLGGRRWCSCGCGQRRAMLPGLGRAPAGSAAGTLVEAALERKRGGVRWGGRWEGGGDWTGGRVPLLVRADPHSFKAQSAEEGREKGEGRVRSKGKAGGSNQARGRTPQAVRRPSGLAQDALTSKWAGRTGA